MVIDVFLCTREDGGHWVADRDSQDHFASIGGFLNMTRMFSLVLDQLRQFEDADCTEALRRFEHYVGEQRQACLARYQHYFHQAQRAARRAKAEEQGVDHLQEAGPEEIDPDARVFFGRLMLTRRTVHPEEAGLVASICAMAAGCFKAFMLHYRDLNPGLAESMARAFETLKNLLYYCHQALAEERPLLFLA